MGGQVYSPYQEDVFVVEMMVLKLANESFFKGKMMHSFRHPQPGDPATAVHVSAVS